MMGGDGDDTLAFLVVAVAAVGCFGARFFQGRILSGGGTAGGLKYLDPFTVHPVVQ